MLHYLKLLPLLNNGLIIAACVFCGRNPYRLVISFVLVLLQVVFEVELTAKDCSLAKKNPT